MGHAIELIRMILSFELFKVGAQHVTVQMLVLLLLLVTAVIAISGSFKRLVVHRVLSRTTLDEGVRESIGAIARYAFVAVGLLVVFQTVGIDLSTLTVIAGALSVGIGFGLQTITNNLISGLIILFERPIKVGDRIVVGNIDGDVVDISIRATTVRTSDNISIIVPNSQFISSTVTNWSHDDRRVRFQIPVGVSYGADPEAVRRILLGVAREHPGVLEDPAPSVLFENFGDSALEFKLGIWTEEFVARPRQLRSEINFAIWSALKANKIEIPFPQRDLWVRGGTLTLRNEAATARPADESD